jgi:hypothetical protein
MLKLVLRLVSWALGLLDFLYLHLAIRRRKSLFFEDGYGELDREVALQTFIRGTVSRFHTCKPLPPSLQLRKQFGVILSLDDQGSTSI